MNDLNRCGDACEVDDVDDGSHGLECLTCEHLAGCECYHGDTT